MKNKPKPQVQTQGAIFAAFIADMFKPEENNNASTPKDDKEAERNRDKKDT